MWVRKNVNDRFASGTYESHFRKSKLTTRRHKETQRSDVHLVPFAAKKSWALRAAGGLLAGRRSMEAEARAHAFLPRALLSFTFFNLRPNAGQRFASELTHLDVQQRRHDRD